MKTWRKQGIFQISGRREKIAIHFITSWLELGTFAPRYGAKYLMADGEEQMYFYTKVLLAVLAV